MTLLFLSLLMLAIGPVLYGQARRASWTRPLLDGFVLASVGALVIAYVLPHTMAVGGYGMLVLAGLGAMFPGLLERWARAGRGAERAILLLAVAALGLHATLDGLALASSHKGPIALSLAVLIHRVSMGLAVWWLVRPRFGAPAAAGLLTLVALSTVAGFALEQLPAVEAALHGTFFAGLQAFVAGSLLHVLMHRSASGETSERSRQWTAAGVALGLVIALALPALLGESHEHVHAHATEHSE